MANEIIAYRGHDPYIFVSYAHVNKEIVHSFISALQEIYNVWFDEGLSYDKPGYKEEIISKIRGCSVFLSFVTKEYLSSPFCNRELGYWETCPNREQKSQIIVLPEDIPLNSVMDFANQQYLPLWRFSSPEEAVSDLKRKSDALKAAEKKQRGGNLRFKRNDHSETCEIAGLGDCTDIDLVLPSTSYIGRVTKIGAGAFLDCRTLTSVVVPEGVTKIGNRAFLGCHALASITLPESVTEIGEEAFSECYNLSSITLPKNMAKIGEEAFQECKSLRSITIPGGVKKIARHLFRSCNNLTSVSLPDSVTEVGHGAFSFCSNLSSIVIPDSVTEIQENAFGRCHSLTSIVIPNSVTKIGPNAFHDCMGLASFSVPSGVSIIQEYMFTGCKQLGSATISDGVTEIGSYAFENCQALNSISIPTSVTKIGGAAFSGCKSLTSILYSGTKAQWKSINKDWFGLFFWDTNTSLYTVHCTDGDIEKE